MTDVMADALLFVWQMHKNPKEVLRLLDIQWCERNYLFHNFSNTTNSCRRCGKTKMEELANVR